MLMVVSKLIGILQKRLIKMSSVTERMAKCEVCKTEMHEGRTVVLSVPGIPYSARFCHSCRRSGAIPYHLLVANTQCIGGYDQSADWWRDIIKLTLEHLGITMKQFLKEVKDGGDLS